MYTDQNYTSLAEEQWLGEPHSGDVDQGVGVSTSQLQNPNVSLGTTTQNTSAQVGGNSWMFIWGAFIVILILVKILAEKAGKAEDFKTVRVGFENWFLVGLMAASFIFAGKLSALLIKWPPLAQFFAFI